MLKALRSAFSPQKPAAKLLKLIPHFTLMNTDKALHIAAQEKHWQSDGFQRSWLLSREGHSCRYNPTSNYELLKCTHMLANHSTLHLLKAAQGGSDVAAWQLVKDRRGVLKPSLLPSWLSFDEEEYLAQLEDVILNLATRDSRFLGELFRRAKEEKNTTKRANAWQIARSNVNNLCDPSYETVWAAESIFFDDNPRYVDIVLAAARRGDPCARRYLKQWKEDGIGAVNSQERFDQIANTKEVAKYVEKATQEELDDDLSTYFGENLTLTFLADASSEFTEERNQMLEQKTELFEKLMKSPRLSEETKKEVLKFGIMRRLPAALCWHARDLEAKGKPKEALDMFIRSASLGGTSVPYAMTKVAKACWSQADDVFTYELPAEICGEWGEWPKEVVKMQRYDDMQINEGSVEMCTRSRIPVREDLERWAAEGDEEAGRRLANIEVQRYAQKRISEEELRSAIKKCAPELLEKKKSLV